MDEQPTSLVRKILTGAIAIAASVALLRWSVGVIAEIWWVLVIIGLVVFAAMLGLRLWRDRFW